MPSEKKGVPPIRKTHTPKKELPHETEE